MRGCARSGGNPEGQAAGEDPRARRRAFTRAKADA